MPASDLVRVALIGFGHWGPNYARILAGTLGGARLVACAEPSAGRLAAFERRYEQSAAPFEWKFTRTDLAKLLERLADKPDYQAAA